MAEKISDIFENKMGSDTDIIGLAPYFGFIDKIQQLSMQRKCLYIITLLCVYTCWWKLIHN